MGVWSGQADAASRAKPGVANGGNLRFPISGSTTQSETGSANEVRRRAAQAFTLDDFADDISLASA